MKSQKIKILVVVAALAAIAIIVPNTNSFVLLLCTRALAFAILVMSLDILLGYTGLASLGQAAYLGVGAYLTVNAPDPTSSPPVRVVRAARPSGVGLIPLELDNVRLNTPAAVYVDWKSHPYASADLAEWQRRIATARVAETDDAAFCRLIDQEKIRWVMLRRGRAVPACIDGWQPTGSDGVRIYIR